MRCVHKRSWELLQGYFRFRGWQFNRKPLYLLLVITVAGNCISCATSQREAVTPGSVLNGETGKEEYWASLDHDQFSKQLGEWLLSQDELNDLLFEAAQYSDNAELISMILDAGALSAVRREEGWTVLMEAAEHNPNPAVIELLVARDSPLNAVDTRGWTALMEAVVSNPNPEIALALIELGADINARDEYGWSPLLFAVQHRNELQFIIALIDKGADIHMLNDHRINALMWAASRSSSPQIIEALLARGADGRIRDRGGRNAYDLALKNPALADSSALDLLKQEAERLP